jgi:hypothetical protein
MLARAGKLYYSSSRDGLTGFDCAVHPDWRALFISAQPGTTVTDDDPRVAQLKLVKIKLHGRMRAGASSLDWDPPANPDKPLDKDSIEMLDAMHKATEQTLQGFMQFWAPFVDGSAIPSSSEGMVITKTGDGYKLHADQNGTSVTEVLDKQLTLTQFTVVMTPVTVSFSPSYKSTDKGLLVSAFQAHIQPAGASPGPGQEMHVEVHYQAIDGFPIPSSLLMNVVNSGEFDFVLDACTVSRESK